jgi:integrase
LAQDAGTNVANALRLKPLLMTQRYAGLRLSDANKLMPTQIQGNRIVIEETTKTGTGIYVTVPPNYLVEMTKVDKKSPSYFFWSGNGDPVTQVKDWQALILQAFTRAKIAKGATQMMSHRMRDTFAKDYMETGGDIEDLARILGHGNSNITRKYYLKWSVGKVRAAAQAKKTWKRDPLQNPSLLERKAS